MLVNLNMSVIDIEASRASIRTVKYNILRKDIVFMTLSSNGELAVFTLDVSNRPRRIYIYSTHSDILVEAFFVTQNELVTVTDKGRIALTNYFEGKIVNVCTLSVGIICCAILYEQYLFLGVKTGGVVAVDWTQLPTYKLLSGVPSRPLFSIMCTEVTVKRQDMTTAYLFLMVFLSTSFTVSIQLYTSDLVEYSGTSLQKISTTTSATSCILHLLWISQDLVLAAFRINRSRGYFHCSIETIDLSSYLKKSTSSTHIELSRPRISFHLKDLHPIMRTLIRQLRTETLDKWIMNCPIIVSLEGLLLIVNKNSFNASLNSERKPFIASYHSGTVTSVCYYNHLFISGDDIGHVYLYSKKPISSKNDSERS